MLVVGQSSPLYQPNIYHPYVYALYYTQTPYSYISVLTGCLTHLGPAGASWGQLVPAGASWYNTLKLASCHVHRPCLNPLQSPHRVMTSKQESSTSLVSQFGKSVKC